jgi:hypothetical protein
MNNEQWGENLKKLSFICNIRQFVVNLRPFS